MTESPGLFPLSNQNAKLEDCARPLIERLYSLAQSVNGGNFAYREEDRFTKILEKSLKMYYL